jgi:hypothetical protein
MFQSAMSRQGPEPEASGKNSASRCDSLAEWGRTLLPVDVPYGVLVWRKQGGNMAGQPSKTSESTEIRV